jgi:hypothetical protein
MLSVPLILNLVNVSLKLVPVTAKHAMHGVGGGHDTTGGVITTAFGQPCAAMAIDVVCDTGNDSVTPGGVTVVVLTVVSLNICDTVSVIAVVIVTLNVVNVLPEKSTPTPEIVHCFVGTGTTVTVGAILHGRDGKQTTRPLPWVDGIFTNLEKEWCDIGGMFILCISY